MNKLYQEAIKEKDIQKKIQKRQAYTKYRNKIVDLLTGYHNKYFEDNKKNYKAFWDGIHQIIYSEKKRDIISPSSLLVNAETITDKLSIGENFNNIFTLTGKKIRNKIYSTNRHYSDYLKSS